MAIDPWSGDERKIIGGVSNIPNVLKGQQVLIPTGYGTAATNQTENSILTDVSGTDYDEIYIVPVGKTFYVTSIICAFTSDVIIATGGAGSEVDRMRILSTTEQLNFSIPLKFSAGTRISGKEAINSGSFISLVGWEE